MRACAAVFILGAVLWAAAASAGPLFVLGAEDGAGPWGRKDGTGCGNDLVRAAFRAAGAEVRLEVFPYARAKAMTLNGELAGCFSMSWEPSFEEKIVFGKNPLYTAEAVVYECVEAPLKSRTLAGIPSGATVGTVNGYEYPAGIGLLKSRGVHVIEMLNEEVLLRRLANGQISSAILMVDRLKNEPVLLARAGATGKVRRAFVAGSQGSFVGFSVKHPMGAQAKRTFDKGYGLLLRNGTRTRIVDEWKRMVEKDR
jgi:polar amino acid transport system substrate-binding protein